MLPTSGYGIFFWNNVVPTKVTMFVWKAIRNVIPSREHLFKKGFFSQEENLYVGCKKELKITSHLFFECEWFSRV